MKTKRDILPHLALVFYTVFLVWCATRPTPEFWWVKQFWDKVQHVSAFFLLAALVLWARGYPQISCDRFIAIGSLAVFYAATVGGLIEILQSKVPGRYAEWLDWVADLLGAVAAVTAGFAILRRQERQKRSAHAPHP